MMLNIHLLIDFIFCMLSNVLYRTISMLNDFIDNANIPADISISTKNQALSCIWWLDNAFVCIYIYNMYTFMGCIHA